MALCFEWGVAEIWQVLRKSSACWLMLLAVLCGQGWGAPPSAALQGCTGACLGQLLNAPSSRTTSGVGWQSVTRSYFSISHCRSDLQTLSDPTDMSKYLCVCPCKCMSLPDSKYQPDTGEAQVSDSISKTNSLVETTCWVKGKRNRVMLQAGEPVPERSSVHASALGNLSLELSQGWDTGP